MATIGESTQPITDDEFHRRSYILKVFAQIMMVISYVKPYQ